MLTRVNMTYSSTFDPCENPPSLVMIWYISIRNTMERIVQPIGLMTTLNTVIMKA